MTSRRYPAEPKAGKAESPKPDGYMTPFLIRTTLPHSDPGGTEWVRVNGRQRLKIIANSDYGLPYGSMPRLLLVWLVTEVTRKESRDIYLGPSLSRFLEELGLMRTGPSLNRLYDQMLRLFTAHVYVTERSRESPGDLLYEQLLLTDSGHLLGRKRGSWQDRIRITERFYALITDPRHRAIPFDMATLRSLRKSPLAIDLYLWLTHRFSYQKSVASIPWSELHAQFGGDYARIRDFKAPVRRALMDILEHYPQANVEVEPIVEGRRINGLYLRPSPTHVLRQA